MKLSRVTALVCMVLLGLLAGTTYAAMVDFETPTYAAGFTVIGVDGWEEFIGASTTVNPDTWIGDSRVLEGSQSMRMDGARSIVTRPFDAGPIGYDTGTIVKTRMLVDNTADAMGEFYFSHEIDPGGSSTPAGIIGAVGGNFQLFGYSSPGVAGSIDTGIAFSADTDYLLEIELDLDTQSFNAFATDMTSGGARTSLGSAPLALAGHLLPGDYATSGFALISRVAPVIYDEMDVDVVIPPDPDPVQPGTVGFELPTYTAGSGVVGLDGWTDFLGATTVVTPDGSGSGDIRVLEGSQSLRLSGARSILQRNFGPGSAYDDGSVVSARMMLDGPDGGHGEFFFSHDQVGLLTPAGIVAIAGENFFTFGFENGVLATPNGSDSGVAVLTNVDYLLELVLDLPNQSFESFVTNLTDDGPRTSLGIVGFGLGEEDVVEAADNSNSGFVVITRNDAVAIFDELAISTVATPDLPGDANGDGVVDNDDAATLAANWQTATGASWSQGDFNGDGAVDDIDATILATNWQPGGSASVPEPTAIVALLGLLIGIMVVRRR